MSTTCNGAIFSIDSLLAFTIILFALLAFAVSLANYEHEIISSSEQFFLEEKTILAADSFVKNHSSENSLLGSAILDTHKKRVRSNELSSLNFSGFEDYNSGKFFVAEVSVGKNVIYYSKKESNYCFAVKRFVLVDSVKKIISYRGCLSE